MSRLVRRLVRRLDMVRRWRVWRLGMGRSRMPMGGLYVAMRRLDVAVRGRLVERRVVALLRR